MVSPKHILLSSIISINPVILFIITFGCAGSHCCAWAFSSCAELGLLFLVVPMHLVAVAPLVAEHGHIGFCSCSICRLSSCSSCVQLLQGIQNLPRSAIEPVSPALAGRVLSTAPPGKSLLLLLLVAIIILLFDYYYH